MFYFNVNYQKITLIKIYNSLNKTKRKLAINKFKYILILIIIK